MSFTQTSWAKNARRNPIQAQHEEVVECKGLRLGVPLALGSVVRSAANFLFILNQEQTVKSRAGGKATTPAYPLRRNTSTPEILLGQPTKLEKLPLGTPQEGAMGHLFMVSHPWHPSLADVPHVICSIHPHRGKSEPHWMAKPQVLRFGRFSGSSNPQMLVESQFLMISIHIYIIYINPCFLCDPNAS